MSQPIKLMDLSMYEGAETLNIKEKMLVTAMIQTYGNVTMSTRAIGIDRKTYYNWRRDNPILRDILDSQEFQEQMKDHAEYHLMKNIEKGKEISTIFFLKTKAQDRGYIERKQIEHKIPEDRRPSWFDDADAKELPPVAVPPNNSSISDIDFETLKDEDDATDS